MQEWVWPLDPLPEVVRVFDPPAQRWGAGHRGVDLLGSTAQPVLAIGAGEIAVARPLAGRGVVVVSHGALRSTYEPVTASVHVGQHVEAGEVVGLLQSARSHCLPEVCLHLGLRRGDEYVDPLSVLGPRVVRLKPVAPSDRRSAYSRQAEGRERVAPTSRAAAGPSPRRRLPAAVGAGAVLAVALVVSSLVGRHARG